MSLEVNKKITENCVITYIEENYEVDGELITVLIYITFLGNECEVYVVIEHLEEEEPKYALIDSSSEVHSSLIDALDTPKAWKDIREAVKEYKVYLKEIESWYN